MPRAVRTDIVQPDGRHVHLYGDFEPAPAGYRAPAMPNGVYQRRWNPLGREWVLVAASRQARTFLPERDECPLCPSRPEHSTEIPAARFQAAVFENRFPAMVPWPPAGGLCEVVVYTDEHDGSFATLPPERLDRLAEVWTDRYRELSARRGIKYVFIFENRGEQVGVTLHHPHGQIYAYPFVPPVAATAQAHLHIEFYPILRDRGKLKYLAGSESGAGVFINDTLAEESADRLRGLLE